MEARFESWSSGMIIREYIIGTVLILILSGLGAAGRGDPREAIEAANAEFAAVYSRGDAAALAAMYTERGQLFPPNEKIVEGRAAIEKFWKAAMDSGIKTVELKTNEVEGLGESAVEVGSYMLYGKDGAAMDRGKYLMLWKRVDGTWKFHRDCWNSNQPASR
jgi:uncharacterized protein (TIGR02246 family)